MIVANDAPGKQGMAILPLALVLTLHLILVLLWVSSERRPNDQGAEQRYFSPAWIPAPKLKKAPLREPLPTSEVAAPVVRPPAATAASVFQAAPAADQEPLTGPAQISQPDTASVSTTPAAVNVGQMIETAKRAAGVVDSELRGGKPAPLKPDPNLPIVRFKTALESAYIDRSTSMTMDAQTQPDGVIVYRFRRGGKVWCRQSGGSGPSMLERSEGAKLAGAGSAGGAGTAGTVTCPSGEGGWSPL